MSETAKQPNAKQLEAARWRYAVKPVKTVDEINALARDGWEVIQLLPDPPKTPNVHVDEDKEEILIATPYPTFRALVRRYEDEPDSSNKTVDEQTR